MELDRVLMRQMAIRVGQKVDQFFLDLDKFEVYRRCGCWGGARRRS